MNIASDFSVIYDSEYLNIDYHESEINKTQRWLGVSFNYLSSMDRRFYDRSNLTDNRNQRELNIFLTGLTTFFKDFYSRNKIKFFINTLEDDAFSVIAYYVAKKLKIDIIGLMGSRFPKSGMFFGKDFSDVYEWNDKVDKVDWGQIYSLFNEKTISGEEILKKNIEYWNLNSLPQRFRGLNYILNYKKYRNYVNGFYPYERFIFEDIRLINEIKNYITKFFRLFLIKRILTEPLINEKYFLFSLHYMEDAQITFREPLFDQFKLIRDISRSLPAGYFLYVKPHPHYLGTDLSFRKLYEVSKLTNIKIIDPKYRPIKLIKNAEGVITLNSTTGFESLIMGVPVITMGHDFYCKSDICNVIRDLNDLPTTLMRIVNKETINDPEIIKDFVKKVYKNTKWLSSDYGPPNLKPNDGKKIAHAIDNIINKQSDDLN